MGSLASRGFRERSPGRYQVRAFNKATGKQASRTFVAPRAEKGAGIRAARAELAERGGAEQLLHGEPHPGTVLTTNNGLLFIDLETCCRGPVEFDLAQSRQGERCPSRH